MNVDSIAVIGAGTMGSGIAQVFLQHGFTVTLIDREEEQLKEAQDRIRDGLNRADSGEQDHGILEHLVLASDPAAVADADLILEAVPEDEEIKGTVFATSADHNPDAIYASNTSSIPIGTLATYAPDPSKCVGMHFFNPAPVMDIVEVVATEDTSDETLETIQSLVEEIGKTASTVQDVPGFVSNRILMPFINEAIKTLEQDIASKEDIDQIAENGFNHPMGPLRLADFIGLDVCLDIMERMYEETGEDRFRPANLLQQKVEEGLLGKKTGDGFYTYE